MRPAAIRDVADEAEPLMEVLAAARANSVRQVVLDLQSRTVLCSPVAFQSLLSGKCFATVTFKGPRSFSTLHGIRVTDRGSKSSFSFIFEQPEYRQKSQIIK